MEERETACGGCPHSRGSDLCGAARQTLLVDWQAEGQRLFGPDTTNWEFVCPGCGRVQSKADLLALSVFEENADQIIGYSCIDRWQTQECMQIGGPVLLTITPKDIRPTFEFNK